MSEYTNYNQQANSPLQQASNQQCGISSSSQLAIGSIQGQLSSTNFGYTNWPYNYPQYTLGYQAWNYPEVHMRKVTNGFILTINNTETVHESIESLTKTITNHYEKKDGK